MSSPTDIDNDRDVNPLFIHAGDEFIGRGQFGIRARVQDSETGVTIEVFIVIFLYLGWNDVGMKVDNHRQIIAEYVGLLQLIPDKVTFVRPL